MGANVDVPPLRDADECAVPLTLWLGVRAWVTRLGPGPSSTGRVHERRGSARDALPYGEERREGWKVIVGRVIAPGPPAAGCGVCSGPTLTADETAKLLSIGDESLSRGDER